MIDKEQIKAIIKQYADKGERLLEEAYENGEHASTTGYWDGYKDCADGLLRELEDMQAEPISEDLEEEIKQYCIHHGYLDSLEDCGYTFNEQVGDIARHFANWQKEQLLAKAVDVTITIPYPKGDAGYSQIVDSKEALPFGEKVKVIVIKED